MQWFSVRKMSFFQHKNIERDSSLAQFLLCTLYRKLCCITEIDDCISKHYDKNIYFFHHQKNIKVTRLFILVQWITTLFYSRVDRLVWYAFWVSFAYLWVFVPVIPMFYLKPMNVPQWSQSTKKWLINDFFLFLILNDWFFQYFSPHTPSKIRPCMTYGNLLSITGRTPYHVMHYIVVHRVPAAYREQRLGLLPSLVCHGYGYYTGAYLLVDPVALTLS
jgi:hypothetical protein